MKKSIILFSAICCITFTSCIPDPNTEPALYYHHITGKTVINLANMDPSKGEVYGPSGNLQQVKAWGVSVGDLQYHSSLMGWTPIEPDEMAILNEDGTFEVTTHGTNERIHIKAKYYPYIGTQPSEKNNWLLDEICYVADTIIRYKNEHSYEDLTIMLYPQQHYVQVKPNPAKMTDSITISTDGPFQIHTKMIRFVDSESGVCLDSISHDEPYSKIPKIAVPQMLEPNHKYIIETVGYYESETAIELYGGYRYTAHTDFYVIN